MFWSRMIMFSQNKLEEYQNSNVVVFYVQEIF